MEGKYIAGCVKAFLRANKMRKNAYAALPECHPLVICSTDGLPLCLEALFQSTIHSCNKLPITGSTDTLIQSGRKGEKREMWHCIYGKEEVM